MMLNLIIDMGTTNTRFYMLNGEMEEASISLPFGAKMAAEKGQSALYDLLHKQIAKMMEGKTEPLNSIYVYGMGGSEYGVTTTERIEAPVDLKIICEHLNRVNIPQLWDVPIYIIPGVRCINPDSGFHEIMRGEETETIGFLAKYPENADCVLILPGSHCKTVYINQRGEIHSFSSAMTGEMIQALAENTILKTAVKVGGSTDPAFLIKGAEAARKYGINQALLQVRTMQCEKNYSAHQMTSFFLGAVLYPEIDYIVSNYGGKTVYIGGKQALQDLYYKLLNFYSQKPPLLANEAAFFGLYGAMAVIKRQKAEERKQELNEKIREHKIIVIIRGLHNNEYLPTVQALYDGGIRFVEVTFDALGKQSDEETAAIIRDLTSYFGEKMWIGAGTVLKPSQVRLAAENGAKYIISPNYDPAIIEETNRLSLISIPGCFTPSEAVEAYRRGADFIKIFPNDLGKEQFIKAIHAPLSHIPLLAVGGVNEQNLKEMIRAGACGVGIGSLLIDKELIAKKDYEALTKKAEDCCKQIQNL